MVEFLLDRKQLNLKAKTSLSTMAEVGGLMLTMTAPMVLESAPARNMRGPDSRYDPRYSDTASDSGSYYSQS